MLFSILGPNSLSIVVAQPDETQANKTVTVLEWYDRHRAKIWFNNNYLNWQKITSFETDILASISMLLN